jgi:hypothetical protein
MGNLSDNLRYTDNKVLKDKMRLADRQNFNPERVFLSAAMGAFDASFTSVVQIKNQIEKDVQYGRPVNAVVNTFYSVFLKPAADAVSPRMADQVASGIAYFNDRQKAYVRLSLENEGLKGGLINVAQKWFSDTWFGEQIQGTADGKFAMIDPHGKPITYDPGDLLFVPAMIMEDMNYGFYDHVSKEKLFDLYLNEKGEFKEGVIAPPTRVSGISDYSEELQEKIKKEVPVIYGDNLEKEYDKLKEMPFEERAEQMKFIYRFSVWEAKVNNGIAAERPRPKQSMDEAENFIMARAKKVSKK